VLLSTPLHASSNFTVSVQLANKRGFKKEIKSIVTRTDKTIYTGFAIPAKRSSVTKELSTKERWKTAVERTQ
jgi:hypothetical protein